MPSFNLPEDPSFHFQRLYWYDKPHMLNRGNVLFMEDHEKEREHETKFAISYEQAVVLKEIVDRFLEDNKNDLEAR